MATSHLLYISVPQCGEGLEMIRKGNFLLLCLRQKSQVGTGELAQWLKTPTAPAEDLGLVRSTILTKHQ